MPEEIEALYLAREASNHAVAEYAPTYNAIRDQFRRGEVDDDTFCPAQVKYQRLLDAFDRADNTYRQVLDASGGLE